MQGLVRGFSFHLPTICAAKTIALVAQSANSETHRRRAFCKVGIWPSEFSEADWATVLEQFGNHSGVNPSPLSAFRNK